MGTDDQAPRRRRRADGKTSGRQDARRVKVTLYLDGDLAKRFAVHAVQTGQDKSELFAEMVRAHCRRFVVSDREREKGQGGEVGESGAA